MTWWPPPLLVIAAILLAVLLGAAGFWAHVRYWVRRLTVSMSYALEERIPTEDGSAIELRRVPPAGPGGETLPPVLLVHGLAANHRNVDLSPDLSLARHLAARGRDVWLVTLRSGLRTRTRAAARLVRFAHMARYDLPLAVRTVLERSGRSTVDLVGFSMGGMLLYAALGRALPQSHVRRVAIIGSPAVVKAPLAALLRHGPLAVVPAMNLRLWARAAAFAAGRFRTPADRWFMNPANVAPAVARMSMINVIESIPGPLNADFAAWAIDGGDLTLDGERVLERLAGVSCPAIFFAGAADRLAPPSSVKAAYDAWGAAAPTEKRFVVLGRADGAHEDYGHADLAMGSHAREDLFEPLGTFLGGDARHPAGGPARAPSAAPAPAG